MKNYFIILLLFLFLIGCQQTVIEEKVIRETAVAGSWYPGTESLVQSTLDDYFSKVGSESVDGNIRAVIAPHAGWRFSGQVAASVFKPRSFHFR